MKTKQPKPPPCAPGAHDPADFAEFERIATNIRSWNWAEDPRMVLGECRVCKSSISYRRPETEPDCFSERKGLSRETVAEIEAIQARAVAELGA